MTSKLLQQVFELKLIGPLVVRNREKAEPAFRSSSKLSTHAIKFRPPLQSFFVSVAHATHFFSSSSLFCRGKRRAPLPGREKVGCKLPRESCQSATELAFRKLARSNTVAGLRRASSLVGKARLALVSATIRYFYEELCTAYYCGRISMYGFLLRRLPCHSVNDRVVHLSVGSAPRFERLGFDAEERKKWACDWSDASIGLLYFCRQDREDHVQISVLRLAVLTLDA
jgi:hypothetical protein